MDGDDHNVDIAETFDINKDLQSRFPKTDEFLRIIRSVFNFARWFGIPSDGGKFSWIWCILLFCGLVTIEGLALWKFFRTVIGVDTSGNHKGNWVARLAGSLFYANAILSTLLTWRFASSWKNTSYYWEMTERASSFLQPDQKLKKKLLFVIYFIATCSIVEHSLSMMSNTSFMFSPSEFLKGYILTSHGFLIQNDEYSAWLGVLIFVMSKTATCLWNFQDSIIILISIGLASRYRRLNDYVHKFTKGAVTSGVGNGDHDYPGASKWRRVREGYVQQACLVRRLDDQLGGLVLLSNFNNFYFICLQLFFGIGGRKPSVINKLYYLSSLSWLCFRACSVVLIAADVNVQSRAALQYMHACPRSSNNIEVVRLERQLCKDYIALGGKGFFYLDRNMLLKVAAAILTYELVLLQYDT